MSAEDVILFGLMVLWSIFPFHPHELGGLLSNRTPTADELKKDFLIPKRCKVYVRMQR